MDKAQNAGFFKEFSNLMSYIMSYIPKSPVFHFWSLKLPYFKNLSDLFFLRLNNKLN